MQRLSSLFIICLAAFAALFSTSCVNAQSSDVTIESIKELTTASENLRVTCTRVNVFSVFVIGPQIGADLVALGVKITKVVTLIGSQGTTPFPDDIAIGIVEVLTTFVQIHQALLSTIIGKHGILSQFGFATPIRLALVALEKAVDSFAFFLIRLIPTRANDGKRAKDQLDVSLKACVTVYS